MDLAILVDVRGQALAYASRALKRLGRMLGERFADFCDASAAHWLTPRI
jgi:hypothetical protein